MAGDRSPARESRCLLQDLALLLEHAYALAELSELDEFLARQPLALTAIDLGLLDRAAQGPGRDAEIAGDLRQRLLLGRDEADGLLPELRRIRRMRSWRLNTPFRACARKRRGVNEIGSTPTPSRFTAPGAVARLVVSTPSAARGRFPGS